MTAQTTTTLWQDEALVASARIGIVTGLFGGGVFGIWMLGAGMFPTISALIGADNVLIGFSLHMLISAVIGGSFGVIATRIPNTLATQVAGGFAYGIVWWIVGALIIMQLVLTGSALNIGDPQVMSLIGHMIFGIIMGTMFYILHNLRFEQGKQ